MPPTKPASQKLSRKTIAQRNAIARTKNDAVQREAGVRGGEITGAVPLLPLPTTSPIVSFFTHGLPAAQGSKTVEGSYKGANGKRVPRLVEQNAIDPWRDDVRLIMKNVLKSRRDWQAIDFPVAVSATFCFPHTGASQARGDLWHITPPDLDKIMRALGDAMTVPPVPRSIGDNMPPNKKRRLQQEWKQQQGRHAFLADDSLISLTFIGKLYCGSPGALKHPGVAVSLYRAPDEMQLLQARDQSLQMQGLR